MDVDSPHVSTVPSDFDAQSVKTSTQAERLEREEEAEAEAAEREREQKRNSSRASGSGKGKSKEKEKEREREKGAEKARAGKEKAKQGAHEAKERAREVAAHAEERAESCIAKLRRNKENPVVVANALLIAAASGFVGYHAYERHLKGMLNWEVVAAWGGAIGVGVGVDYFVSRFVFFSSRFVPGRRGWC